MNNGNYLIDFFKNDDQKFINKFYSDNKNGFLLFAKRYHLQQDDIVDIYQDAVVALIENAKKGKIDNLQSSLTTYLFGIGKFMIFQHLKKKGKTIATENFENFEIEYDDYSKDENNLQIKVLQKSFEQLGTKCKKILQLFYYEEKKLDDIQKMLGYTNKDVLKSQKSRCLKQLKDFARN